MTGRVCKACGGALPTTHGNRRYCSDNCRKRKWEREHKSTCVECGTVIWRGERCDSCFRTELADRRAAIVALRNEGLLSSEIAQRLGTTRASVANILVRERKAGTEVRRSPYFKGKEAA